MIDPVLLTQQLIKQPSVTPAKTDDAATLAQKNAALLGCFDLLQTPLEKMGFVCHRVTFDQPGFPSIPNFYAEYGPGGKHLNFLGHVDVVPPGDMAGWRYDPFGGTIDGEYIYGRGASDMKGNIASFIAAVENFLSAHKGTGKISLLITGDEESYAVNGVPKMVPWLQQRGIAFDYCLVGEPSNPKILGEEVKNGRRGTMNATCTVHGTQGHIAYPERFDNPITRLGKFIAAMGGTNLDDGNEYFAPTRLEVNIIDLTNRTTNVVPNRVTFGFNVRWNSNWTRETLSAHLIAACDQYLGAGRYDLDMDFSGGVYLTPRGDFLSAVTDSVRDVTGLTPQCTTAGGTSDGRFIAVICPFVLECGLVSETIHQVNESAKTDDLRRLADIYSGILKRVLA